LLAGVHDEALGVMRTLAPQTVFARRCDLRPDPRVVRHIRDLALVARRRPTGEGLDPAEIPDVIARSERPVPAGASEVVVTDVIGAALEQRDGHGNFERVADLRKIALKKLVLKRLGAGGNDDLAA